MSSRALRKLQRELDEQRHREEQEARAASEDSETDAPPSAAKPSMFSLLGSVEDGIEGEEEPGEAVDSSSRITEGLPSETKPARKKNKKKKKVRSGKQQSQIPTSSAPSAQLDEIDLALLSLSSKGPQGEPSGLASRPDPAVEKLHALLSVDSQHLHAVNEMRRLFGRAAIEADYGGADSRQARRRGRGPQQAGLAEAVAGRNYPGGRGHGFAGMRKNIFIQGKEEWPRTTGGGLGMEVVERRGDGSIEYRFVHNSTYQDTQRQFHACVASMDPTRMIQLLQFNPYHISTLLQVSEIAKQEGDHATAGDLLERALFSFGRAVHSSFATNLSHGKARLDFRRPENREFWLTAWRYINNLSMRATWRTVFEWAKLLFSLDPENDPFGVRFAIDQFAVRAKQGQLLLDLAASPILKARWGELPSIQLTAALAHLQIQEPAAAREALRKGIEKFPWVVAALFKVLNIDPIPPAIWGKEPRAPREHLLSELYVQRAEDIWNTPEATSVLFEGAISIKSVAPAELSEAPIEQDLARHALLTDNPALLNLIPRTFTADIGTVSDPMPPTENLASYDASPSHAPARTMPENVSEEVLQRLDVLVAIGALQPHTRERLLMQQGLSEEQLRSFVAELESIAAADLAARDSTDEGTDDQQQQTS